LSTTRRAWLFPYLLGGGAFLASNLLAYHLGVHFDASPLTWLWQFLDEDALRTDLLRSVYYLHSQPPLFNFAVGLALKLFPTSWPFALAAAYQLVGLALLIAVAWLLRRLGVPDLLAAGLCLLLALHPTFIVHTRWLFYTYPVALLVLLPAIALARYCDSGSTRWAHGFAWLAAALMLSRAIFHPLWFIGVLAVVALCIDRVRRRTLLVSAIAPLLLVNLWYLKNYTLVGTYGASSWLGMNLRRGLPLTAAEQATLMNAGRLPKVWAERRGFPLPGAYPEYFTPHRPFVHPVLDEPFKRNGRPNLNHRGYARISQDMLRGDIEFIEAYPLRYLGRVRDAFGLFLYPGPRFMLLDPHYPQTFGMPVVHYRDAVNRVLFLSPAIAETPSPAPLWHEPNLLWIGFPAVLLFGLVQTFRRGTPLPGRPADAGLRPLFAYLSLTVLWFTLSANLLELGENDRLRLEIDPAMVVLFGCAVSSLYRRVWPASRPLPVRATRAAARKRR
jgi:hypothetical protein